MTGALSKVLFNTNDKAEYHASEQGNHIKMFYKYGAWYAYILVNEELVKFRIDTGFCVSVLSAETASKLNLGIKSDD